VIHVKINRSKPPEKQSFSLGTALLKTILRLLIISSTNSNNPRTNR